MTTDLRALTVGVASGVCAVVTLIVQKHLDYRRAVSERKMEVYTAFFQGFEETDSRKRKARILNSVVAVGLCGSDGVVRDLHAYLTALRARGESPETSKIAEQLLHAMRKDIYPRTRISAMEFGSINPLH